RARARKGVDVLSGNLRPGAADVAPDDSLGRRSATDEGTEVHVTVVGAGVSRHQARELVRRHRHVRLGELVQLGNTVDCGDVQTGHARGAALNVEVADTFEPVRAQLVVRSRAKGFRKRQSGVCQVDLVGAEVVDRRAL